MQRAIWYTGLAGGGTAIFLSLVVVGSLLFNGVSTGAGASAPDGAPAGSPHATHGGGTTAAPVEANPEAAEYVLRDPTAPERAEGEIHEIELVMSEMPMTVAAGYEQLVWTFGDEVPGPVLRVKVGDVVRITLKHPETNLMPHSIDFHSSMVAWNDEMRSINPGQELVYEFEAKYAGVYMYHCGTSPALMHIANGMFGMIIVEPAEGLPEVDHEFALVQSEWYLGQQGATIDLEKAGAAAPGTARPEQSPKFAAGNSLVSAQPRRTASRTASRRTASTSPNAAPQY